MTTGRLYTISRKPKAVGQKSGKGGHCSDLLKSDIEHKCYIHLQEVSNSQTKCVFHDFETSTG